MCTTSYNQKYFNKIPLQSFRAENVYVHLYKFFSACRYIAPTANVKLCEGRPRAGSGVVRMDPLRFLAGCRTRRLNQA